MRSILHVLLGMERGGCEWDALCLVREAKHLNHLVLVLSDRGPMSDEFVQARATVEHAGDCASDVAKAMEAVGTAVRNSRPVGVLIWHGMVLLPEMLHALHDFRGQVLVHGGNPAWSLPRWVDWRYWFREKWQGRRCAATYVCCTQYVADSFLRSRYLRRFPTVVVFNGVKPLNVPPHTPREIDPGAPFTIGMTARLDRIKDHVTLLRAFASVAREWPAARLELAGDGDQRPVLEGLARELGVIDQVRFLGMVSDVYTVIRDWDIFVYSTTAQEGLGNALAEAMMVGLPSVVTDIGPMGEVGATTVSYVPHRDERRMADVILALAANLTDRKKLSAAARERANSEFSSEVFCRRYLEVLKVS
jgi:glycosyltransferase involved in cell wall biosynthesis